jgi:hypothetical protein
VSGPTRLVKHLLLVEPDPIISSALEHDYGRTAAIVRCPDFHGARSVLIDQPPDVLVTNLRLRDYNGLHLVLLAKAADRRTVCVVHSNKPDAFLIREAQANGAFFERTERLSNSLGGYLSGPLPDNDRRAPDQVDRRGAARGGRRSADHPVSVSTE